MAGDEKVRKRFEIDGRELTLTIQAGLTEVVDQAVTAVQQSYERRRRELGSDAARVLAVVAVEAVVVRLQLEKLLDENEEGLRELRTLRARVEEALGR